MDLKKCARELAELEGIEFVRPERCWVDAREACPYGDPEGQYAMRPEICGDQCRIYKHQVQHVLYHHDEDGECAECEKAEVKAIQDHFKEHRVTVVSELRARAEYLSDESERLILKTAAAILEERRIDRDILIQDDLPDGVVDVG